MDLGPLTDASVLYHVPTTMESSRNHLLETEGQQAPILETNHYTLFRCLQQPWNGWALGTTWHSPLPSEDYRQNKEKEMWAHRYQGCPDRKGHVRTQVATCKLRREASEGSNPADTLTLDF